MADIIYSPAGKLITKKQAPRCYTCGRILWKPIYKWSGSQHDKNGNRLGYVPMHRLAFSVRKPVCWNGTACGARIT